MITVEHLKEEIERSRTDGQTSPFLARLVFTVVDATLADHYGRNYSVRCVQSSLAIQYLLTRLGIKSHALAGSVCLPCASNTDPFSVAWGGFWDKDHHGWVLTEFREIVDLTIGQFHLHPATTMPHEAIPPFWWNATEGMPAVFKYLPNGKMKADFPVDDAHAFERFMNGVSARWESTLKQQSRDDIAFAPILHGIESLNALFDAGHPWARKATVFQDHGIPLPEWIVAREQALIAELGQRRD